MSAQRRPAPPAGSPRRPDPRTGRFRARLSLLLPVLALLLGAVSPFAAAPAAACDGIWCARLNVKDIGSGYLGCANNNVDTNKRCSTEAVLSEDDFTLSGSHSIY